jgi:hypothetical protein
MKDMLRGILYMAFMFLACIVCLITIFVVCIDYANIYVLWSKIPDVISINPLAWHFVLVYNVIASFLMLYVVLVGITFPKE